MASEIISTTIDAAYPVAGVDNDTQGFRDNFQVIKTGLTTAASEITALQNNTAKLNESNDFNGTNISDANLTLNTEQYHNIGTVTTSQNISFLNGHYQRLAINPSNNAITLTLADWPDRDGYARITVEINTISLDPDPEEVHTVTWQVEGGGTIKAASGFPSPFNLNSGDYAQNPGIIEFWTTNQGNTVYANWLGRFTEI